MKIRTYDEINVDLIRSTPDPLDLIKQATAITMKKDFITGKGIGDNICKNLYKMNHTSLLEHVYYTFRIIGASRSFLAQITRHRISSFTSGSQHYQKYSDYGLTLSAEESAAFPVFNSVADYCMETYNHLLEMGVPREEARQVLPGGMENNLMWTVNARSLANFLNLRLCRRNVAEMKVVAGKIYRQAYKHFPALFDYVGPDCYEQEKCTQGAMSCKNFWEKPF